jgi:predicted O-linked N-acetylglucosamine transferase (SPINDLY family)
MSDTLEVARRLAEARALAAAGRAHDARDRLEPLAGGAPEDLAAERLRATLLTQLSDTRADAAWRRVLVLAPQDAEAHFQLGNAAGDRGDFAQAVVHLDAAQATLPDHPVLLNNLGLALEAIGQFDAAAARFRAAVAREPRAGPSIRPSLARVLFRAGRHADALVELDALLATRAPDPAWQAARAACLGAIGRDADARVAYEAAVAADPSAAATWHDYARFLLARKRYDDLDVVLTRAHARLPDDTLILSLLVTTRQRRAAWTGVEALRATLVAQVARPDWMGIAAAYDVLSACDDPALQRRVAERYAASDARAVAASRAPGGPPGVRAAGGQPAGRLRVGFVSADFRDHPVGRLVVGLLERLDRSRFEVVAYATRDARDATGARIVRAVERCVPLPVADALSAAARVRADGIAVLLDLNGYSGGEALPLFAARPARCQVNFLGYTGTLGSAAYDAIVADTYCIPAAAAAHYVEQAWRVDPCYLPSDDDREVVPAGARADYGLPDDGRVLLAQAALYKVSPALFACWMDLLRDVPRAVLWLRDAPPATMARVRAAAAAAGVAPARIVFAPAEPLPAYLARTTLADVMLDTAPFGAHTTVNDALYMGVPVVTIAGHSFAGRASASQVIAAGLTDLVAPAPAATAPTATRLLTLDGGRAACRARAGGARGTALFDLPAYVARFSTLLDDAGRNVR